MVFKNDTQRHAAYVIAKRLFEDGKNVREIAKMMCLSESQVRSLKKTIDETDENK